VGFEGALLDAFLIDDSEASGADGLLEDSFLIDLGLLPNLTGIVPGVGAVNKIIIINGTNFGVTQGSSKVIFQRGSYEYEADIVSWADDQIECYAPEIPEIGNWNVTVRVVSNV
jgi:hypothetical protein